MTASASGVVDVGDAAQRTPRERVPAYVHVLTAAVVLQFMSGSSTLYGMPVPPDRIVLAAGLLMLLAHPDLRRSGLRLEPIHLVMAALVAWCVGSMIWFGPLSDPTAAFALADAIGIVPFLLFLTAPVVFATRARRRVLLRALTALGLYLGYVSVCEGLHLYALIVPQSIVNPSHPHFGRALGPSQQVGSNGLALLACMYPSAVYAAQSRGVRRLVGALACLLCAAGAFFTLTRSIWLALVLGVAVVIVAERAVRGRLLLAAAAAAIGLAVLPSVAPGIGGTVSERAQTSRSVYDRLNANAAAVRVVLARPVEGVGLNRFHVVERDWVWQDPDYPITNMGIDVHNVVLGLGAELGLPGLTLWFVALLWAAWAAVRGPRDRDGPLHDLRVGALAYGVAWCTVAMLVPIKYAFPTAMLWLGLGLVADHRRLGYDTLPTPPSTGGDEGPGGRGGHGGPGRDGGPTLPTAEHPSAHRRPIRRHTSGKVLV